MAGSSRPSDTGLNELGRLLARRIRLAGPLSVADYMAEALGHPHHGYYATRDPLGAGGDFVTAPEITQIFGELIGLWCADGWVRMGRPDPVILAELGPGRGTLMKDALRASCVVPEFRRALRLHLVETSPVLRQMQAEALADADPCWHHSFANLPEGPLIVIANEFLDALPIRQFVRREKGWHERRVALAADGASLIFALDAAPSVAGAALIPAALSDALPGSLVEVRPAALSLAAAIGKRFATEGGRGLFIDYGHGRGLCGETLQAVRGHQRHEVLADPGEADLTAHVDFAAFAEAAIGAGARAWGPLPQGMFLTALGLAERAAALLKRATPSQTRDIESACRRLIDPAEMGTLFKVMALADPALSAPAGFGGSENT